MLQQKPANPLDSSQPADQVIDLVVSPGRGQLGGFLLLVVVDGSLHGIDGALVGRFSGQQQDVGTMFHERAQELTEAVQAKHANQILDLSLEAVAVDGPGLCELGLPHRLVEYAIRSPFPNGTDQGIDFPSADVF